MCYAVLHHFVSPNGICVSFKSFSAHMNLKRVLSGHDMADERNSELQISLVEDF